VDVGYGSPSLSATSIASHANKSAVAIRARHESSLSKWPKIPSSALTARVAPRWRCGPARDAHAPYRVQPVGALEEAVRSPGAHHEVEVGPVICGWLDARTGADGDYGSYVDLVAGPTNERRLQGLESL
jgi:hypothetical protein